MHLRLEVSDLKESLNKPIHIRIFISIPFSYRSRYLTTCSRGGINFNKKKFKFAEDVVNYIGFTITRDEIKPAAVMTESIRNFQAPKNITQARAFLAW